jgi:hypothetical protein
MLTIRITKNEITPASLAVKKIGGEEKSTPPNKSRVGPDTRRPGRSGPIAVSRNPNLTATIPQKNPPTSIFSACPFSNANQTRRTKKRGQKIWPLS